MRSRHLAPRDQGNTPRDCDLITFPQLTPAIPHPSQGGEGHVQTPAFLPTCLLLARPVSGWWAGGPWRHPSAVQRSQAGEGEEGFAPGMEGPSPAGLPTRVREGQTLIESCGPLRKLLPREKSRFPLPSFPGCGEPSLLGWQGRLPETSIPTAQKPRDWSKNQPPRNSEDSLKTEEEVVPTLMCSEALFSWLFYR